MILHLQNTALKPILEKVIIFVTYLFHYSCNKISLIVFGVISEKVKYV